MFEYFANLFSTDFMPHGHCFLWRPEILWVHVVSDAFIAIAYAAIPFALFRLVRLRRDLAFDWMFLLFGLFILACGTTHVMSIVTLWIPVYRLEGVVKAVTALASVPTAFLLIGLVPRVVKIPSAEQLRQANRELEAERQQVRKLNQELENRVSERTAALAQANTRLADLTRALNLAQAMIRKADGTILFWSQGSQELYGWNSDEALGKDSNQLLETQSVTPLEQIQVELLNSGQWQGELTHRKRDGSRVVVASHWSLQRGGDGAPVAITEVNNDITVQKQVELELLRTNEDLRHFAYAASHDLREPLRMVVIYTQLLAKDYQDKLDENAAEFINFAVEGALRMETLLTGLQQYWQTADQRRANRTKVDCNLALQQAKLNLGTAIDENGATVTSDRLPVIFGEEVALIQLFQNLIANAIKYRAAESPVIHVSGEIAGGIATFSVRDNGIGIQPEYRGEIFGVFKRLHGSRYPGAGIGLSICRRLVELHGGRIWVEQAAGQGSKFMFTLNDAAGQQ
ncbi:MAG: ATP-binding protein [Bryobacteraceae bacterium]